MHYDPRPFRETADHIDVNKDIVRATSVSPATLHSGEPAVLIKLGRTFAVIPIDEAIKFATLLADTVDKAKAGSSK